MVRKEGKKTRRLVQQRNELVRVSLVHSRGVSQVGLLP